MQKKSSPISVLNRSREKTPVPVEVHMLEKTKLPKLRLWFVSLLVLGVIILALTSFATWNWLRTIKFTTNTTPTQAPSTTFSVQRTAPYAGLSFTIVNAQYATSFLDDAIHSGAAVVRLNMHVANPSSDQISVFYYDIARLLAPHQSQFAPTNVSLSAGPAPGKSENGWIDFAVPAGLQLSDLKLQLGSTLLGEYLVTIPFSGSFSELDASRYTDHTSQQSLVINYTFQGHVLSYRLLSVEKRYSYLGSQVKAGQEFYILNFRVDNPNGVAVSPGYGYDYIRLVFNAGPLPPSDNTLPYGFKAGAKGVTGHVAYTAPAGLRSLTIDFLIQYGSGGTDFRVSI
jgi:hypothetical protein